MRAVIADTLVPPKHYPQRELAPASLAAEQLDSLGGWIEFALAVING